MEVERYSHVMHIVSTVEGDLRGDLTALDALAAAFPAGTVSGAPKVRAMEIIDELEPTRRGPYAGATGYYGIDGRLDTCITLATALLKDGAIYFQAGGGVVADSVPSLEYEETRNKARAIRWPWRSPAAAGCGSKSTPLRGSSARSGSVSAFSTPPPVSFGARLENGLCRTAVARSRSFGTVVGRDQCPYHKYFSKPDAYRNGPLGRYGVRGPSSPLVQMGPAGESERPASNTTGTAQV